MKKKIKITESQLKMLRKSQKVIKEQFMDDEMDNDGGNEEGDDEFGFPLKMVVMSHLSDVQEGGNLPEEFNTKINFVKRLIMSFQDLNQKVSETELNKIYNDLSRGSSEPSNGGIKIDKEGMDLDNLSLNESITKEKIIGEFKRFL
jgi:hypothetical protein